MFAQTAALCAFAFLAGFIDSVVGGGGLIQLPALLNFLPRDTLQAMIFGTSKCAAVTGTSFAAWNFSRHVEVDWRAVGPAAVGGLIFSVLGARAISLLHPAVLRPLVLGLLVTVAAYTLVRKDFGSLHAPRLSPAVKPWIGFATGGLLGFYDGFFGPGTGSFLIFIFIGVFGFNFLSASAAAKIVNTATNISAVTYFGSAGQIIYRLALPMAGCSMLGSLVGSRLAIRRGSGFVRVLFLVVVTALVGKLAFDMARGR